MGWKDWVYGDLVSAADFQSLVQDQTVQRYADSAARTSALGSAVAEGMVSYLDDTNAVEVYNGAGWNSLSGGSGNVLINAGFDINQRQATSTTTSGAYVFDRWAASVVDGTSTYSAQTFTVGEAPVSALQASNYARLVSTGQTATNALTSIVQRVESVRSLANQTVTVSFWAKAASGTPSVVVWGQQDFGLGGSPSTSVNFGASKQTISTTWTRYSFTLDVPSISGKTIGTGSNDSLAIRIVTSAGTDRASYTGSLGIQSATIDIWGVQLEAGSSATPFKRNAPSIQGELAACQRYYWRTASGTGYTFFGVGQAMSSTTANFYVTNPVPMRLPVQAIEYSTLGVTDGIAIQSAVTSLSVTQASTLHNNINVGGVSGLTTYRPYYLSQQASTAGYLAFSAEL